MVTENKATVIDFGNAVFEINICYSKGKDRKGNRFPVFFSLRFKELVV